MARGSQYTPPGDSLQGTQKVKPRERDRRKRHAEEQMEDGSQALRENGEAESRGRKPKAVDPRTKSALEREAPGHCILP